MNSTKTIEQLQAEVHYFHDRIALLRMKLYGRGLGTDARLERLQQELERAEEGLRDERLRTKS